ncbi:MAG: hypothetical protein U5J64_00825 [Halobacteriales archaeon]|nr:hypothetical protein [Halobacteriales archaeon]
MRYPASEQVSNHESSFETAHTEARKKEFVGSLVLNSSGGDGVVVYLDGWPVYAKFKDDEEMNGEMAVDYMKTLSGNLDRHVSRRDPVEMFRTYMEYIGREEGLITMHRTDEVEVRKRTILVTESGTLEKTEVPAGVRLGYSADKKQAKSFFSDEGITGYALSNKKVMFFKEGEEVDRKQFKEDDFSMLVRMDSEEGLGALECEFLKIYTQGSTGGQVDVEFDIQGWEIVEEKEDNGGGLLSGILGR